MYWTLLWSMFSIRKLSGSEFTTITFILPQVGIPKMHRHGRIKKYTTKRTMKLTEKNYKMKRNTFVFKEREVFKERQNIIEEGEKEEYDLLPPGSSFIRDLAEMNAV